MQSKSEEEGAEEVEHDDVFMEWMECVYFLFLPIMC